jgi:antitoxin ParD1/3/4
MPSGHTKNVVLSGHNTSFVDELVQSDRYQNASEVLREGLRVLEDRIKRDEAELAEIKGRIAQSLEQLDLGDVAQGTLEEVFDRALERAAATPRRAEN